MSGQNRIIALVDFEENASNFIAAVDILSRTLSAEIVFVHKLTGYSPSMAFQDVRENLAKLEKKKLMMHSISSPDLIYSNRYGIKSDTLTSLLHWIN